MDIARKKILVVDDNEDMRTLLGIALENMGVEHVMLAEDVPQALDLIERAVVEDLDGDGPVDLILCDWNMPGMNGLDFLHYLREHGYEMPFIMITGRGGGLESIHEARAASATSFIQKPCSAARLEVEVRMAMKRRVAA